MSLLIGDNLMVSLYYTLTDDDGNILDSSCDPEPMTYLHGANNIVPGLENALTGRAEGDALQIHIEPEDAYGESLPELIHQVNITTFHDADNIEVGMRVETQTPEGHSQLVEVKEINGDEIIIDTNHPLAGITLNFAIEIINIREATQEEIEYGHQTEQD